MLVFAVLSLVLAGCGGTNYPAGTGAGPTDAGTATSSPVAAGEDIGDGTARENTDGAVGQSTATSGSPGEDGEVDSTVRQECTDTADRLTSVRDDNAFIGTDASGATVGQFASFQFCHEARYVLEFDYGSASVSPRGLPATYQMVLNVTDASTENFTMRVTYRNETVTYDGGYDAALGEFMGSETFFETMNWLDAEGTWGITGHEYVEEGEYTYSDAGSQRQVFRATGISTHAGVDCFDTYQYFVDAGVDPTASSPPADAFHSCVAPGHGIAIYVEQGSATMTLVEFEEH